MHARHILERQKELQDLRMDRVEHHEEDWAEKVEVDRPHCQENGSNIEGYLTEAATSRELLR